MINKRIKNWRRKQISKLLLIKQEMELYNVDQNLIESYMTEEINKINEEYKKKQDNYKEKQKNLEKEKEIKELLKDKFILEQRYSNIDLINKLYERKYNNIVDVVDFID